MGLQTIGVAHRVTVGGMPTLQTQIVIEIFYFSFLLGDFRASDQDEMAQRDSAGLLPFSPR